MIKLYEKVNLEKLKKVIGCDNLPSSDSDDHDWSDRFRRILTKYKNKTVDSKVLTTYKQNDKKGRYYTSYGLQNFQNDVRNYLADDLYMDIDMVNAHPTILLSLGVESIRNYIENRKDVLAELEIDKKQFCKFLNKCVCSIPKLKDLHAEIYGKLVPELKKKNRDLWKLVRTNNTENPYNLDGKFLSLYLQSVENNILQILVDCLKGLDITIGALIHDGLMFEKQLVGGVLVNPLSDEQKTEL